MFHGGEILGDTYQIIQEIGKGGTGVVYLAWHTRLGKEVVVKRIFRNFIGKMNVRAEVDILKRLHHSGLPQVYDFLQIGSDIYTVMEYIQGYDLQYYIDNGYKVDEKQSILWLQQLCSVLDYLHSRNPKILHSDIKPGNIMITPEGNICLIDFNISLDGQNNTGLKGLSEKYAAPEQYYKASLVRAHQDSSGVELDERMDIYSLGATFYTVMTGMLPELTSHRQYPITSMQIPYSEGLKKIIDKAMAWQIGDRFSSAKAMHKAVDNVYKYDSKYKQLMTVRLISHGICAILLVLGIWSCVYGSNKMLHSDYESDYQAFVSACDNFDDEEIINSALAILNNDRYEKILSEEPEYKARLLNQIGNVYFDQEIYGMAAQYYRDAIDAQSYESLFYRNYSIASARDSDIEEAEYILWEAENLGISDSNLELAAQEIAYFNNDFEKVIEIGEQLKNAGDNEIVARSSLITARAYSGIGDISKQIEYLNIAYESNGGIRCTRELGRVCLEFAQVDNRNSDQLLDQSENCFRKLWESSYGNETDGLNLAIVLELKGRYSESLSILEQLMDDGTEMYQVYAHASYILLETDGSIDTAVRYCRKAESIYEKADIVDESFEVLREVLEQKNGEEEKNGW